MRDSNTCGLGSRGGRAVKFPAHRNFESFCEEGVATRERHGFGAALIAVVGANFPDEEALDLVVADGEAGLLAFEGQGKFTERLADGFGEAVFELEAAGELFEELLASEIFGFAGAEETHAEAGNHGAEADDNPVEDVLDAEGVFERHAGDDADGGGADKNEDGVFIAMSGERENDKEEEEPKRGDGGSEIEEDGEDEKVGRQRNLKTSFADITSGDDEGQGNEQIGDQEDDGAAAGGSASGFDEGDERESDENGAGQSDLAFEIEALGAFERHRCPFLAGETSPFQSNKAATRLAEPREGVSSDG